MNDPRGQGIVEYALLLALIAIVAILVLTILGQQVSQVFHDISCQMPAASCN
jgi:pilus assembly protein Flp/PilA